MEQKKNEVSFKESLEKVRPRNLFNPPDTIKLVLGHFNKNLISWLKRTDDKGDPVNRWFI